MLANFVIEELAPANVARFNVLAQFPDIAISLTPEQTTITDTVNIQYSATVQGSTQGVTWSVESGAGLDRFKRIVFVGRRRRGYDSGHKR